MILFIMGFICLIIWGGFIVALMSLNNNIME
jgi:hypothetical protein